MFAVIDREMLRYCLQFLLIHITEEVIKTKSCFARFTIHHRIGKILDVTGGFPDFWVHKNRGIETFNIIAIGHLAPPSFLEVAKHRHTERTIIPTAIQAAIDLGRLEHKPPPFGERYDLFECLNSGILLFCH